MHEINKLCVNKPRQSMKIKSICRNQYISYISYINHTYHHTMHIITLYIYHHTIHIYISYTLCISSHNTYRHTIYIITPCIPQHYTYHDTIRITTLCIYIYMYHQVTGFSCRSLGIVLCSCFLSSVSQEKFRPEVRPVCFFEDRVCTQLPEHRSPRCVASLGYLPNSVLLKRLFPTPDFPPGKIYLSQYRPPDLTEKQLSEIRSLRKVVFLNFSIFVSDVDLYNVMYNIYVYVIAYCLL